MKIALCISGELRCFNEEIIKSGFNKTFGNVEYDTFISTWCDDKFDDNTLENMFKHNYKNVKQIKIDNYNKWFNELTDNLKTLSTLPNPPHKSTSLQQLYKIYDCNKLKKMYEIESSFKYDIVFRIRPDTLFIKNIDLSNFDNGSIFNINFGKYAHNHRIYDIFFYGDSESMDIISNSFEVYESLVENSFDNGLNKVDACRLLYLQTINNNIKILNVNFRLCEVYRGETQDQFINMINNLGYENK